LAKRRRRSISPPREDGGIWSNLDKSLITQPLTAHTVAIRDRSAPPPSPLLECEGFEVHRLAFKAWDSDPAQPFGCLQGAFRKPQAEPAAVPRVSAELRYIAFFDA
jgi:hypothetical protein